MSAEAEHIKLRNGVAAGEERYVWGGGGGLTRQRPWPSDEVCRHHGRSLEKLQGGTYASIRLSLSATTPWDDEDTSTL